MFPLHTSADHAFVINRGLHHQHHLHQYHDKASSCEYSFKSLDDAVSWEVVRRVYHFSHDVETCPICLDSFVVPRITKCGHSFCLLCLIQYLKTGLTSLDKDGRPKCPCCNKPFYLGDSKPVDFITICLPRATEINLHHPNNNNNNNNNDKQSQANKPQQQPHQQQGSKMKFVKLHRLKGCASPFLPRLDCPRRCSPHALPSQNDIDAKYSRFIYTDPESIMVRLNDDYNQLQQEQQQQQQQQQALPHSTSMCRALALEFVETERRIARGELVAEQELQHRFQMTCAGVYQCHPTPLIVTTQPPPQQQQSHNYDEDAAIAVVDPSSSTVPLAEDAGLPLSQSHESTTTTTTTTTTAARNRSASLESEHSHYSTSHGDAAASASAGEASLIRYRSTSIGSETSLPPPHPDQKSIPQHTSKYRSANNNKMSCTPGSMYLAPDETMFFQAEDGQLCFLSGFNMQCLRSEYTTYLPGTEHGQGGEDDNNSNMFNDYTGTTASPNKHAKQNQPQQQQHIQQIPPRRSDPLPDTIQGRVLEVEHVTVTRQLRQRMRFLSHLPYGTPITFVEIAMGGNILSPTTKKLYAKEFAKRRGARERKTRAQERNDDRCRRLEQQRIQQHYAHVPMINRTFRSEPIDITSDAFGPSLLSSSSSSPPKKQTNPTQPPPAATQSTTSFSAIARKASQPPPQKRSYKNEFPALGASSTDPFPPLGSSALAPTKNNNHKPVWKPAPTSTKRATGPTTTTPPPNNNKNNNKGKQLLSTTRAKTTTKTTTTPMTRLTYLGHGGS